MRNTLAQLLIAFVVAFAIKLAYVDERLALPDVYHPVLDSRFHHDWAMGLAFGQWTQDMARLQHEPYFRAPLYPFFVSAIYRALGTSPGTLFRVQAALGAINVALMFCFCTVVFERRTAWCAAILGMLYWPFTYHEAERLFPALSLMLDMLFLIALVLAGRRGGLRYAVMAGLAMGLSAITRPSILVTLPFALWWLNSRRDSQGKQYVAIVVACAMAIIAPVTVRNALVGHDLVFIASQGGVNFFIGNNPSADGVHAVVPGTRADWWGGYDDTRRIAQAGRERVLKPSEISAFWYRRGVAFLFHEPRAAMRLYLRKICLMLGNAEPSNERQLYFQRKHSAVLSVLVVNFAFILASATAGLVVLRARARNDLRDGLLPLLLAVAYALGIVAFFVTSRYRLPVAMFLIPLSAAGCSEMIALARRRAWKRCIPAVLVGSLVAVGSLANPLRISQLADARGAYALGVDYYRDCNYHEAMNWLNQSVQDDSTYAPTWAMLGRACARTGRPEVAIIDLEKACALDSTFSDAFHWLGVVYQKAGNDTLAERAYRRAIALDGTRVETLTNLAGVCFRAGRRENARLLLERALAVDSTYANALYGIGLYWEFNGEYNRATDAYRRALPYVPARVALQRVEHH